MLFSNKLTAHLGDKNEKTLWFLSSEGADWKVWVLCIPRIDGWFALVHNSN